MCYSTFQLANFFNTKLIAALDTLFKKSMFISMLSYINQDTLKFPIKYTFYPIFVSLDVQIQGGAEINLGPVHTEHLR